MKDYKNIFKSESFKQLYELNLIDEIATRNYIIKQEFKLLRKKKIASLDAIYILADKFFLSPDTISSILFRKPKKNNNIINKFLLKDE